MAQIIKNNSKSLISERLYQGYQTALQIPGHKSMIQLPTGTAVYVWIESKASLKGIKDMFKEKQISNGHQLTEKPLKNKGLTVRDILKRMPKIRAQLIKKRYGI